MSVLDRSELEQSHLADLHAIASEFGIEGFRKLGRDQLIDAILGGGGGDAGGEEPAAAEPDDSAGARKRGGRRGLRLRRGKEEADNAEADVAPGEKAEVVIPEGDDTESSAAEPEPEPEAEVGDAPAERPERQSRQRGGRERRPKARPERESEPEEDDEGEGEDRAGVLDILPGGSGFMREDAFVHSRDDVYVSPAQIRRCELRAGDQISGPVRPPRRSERYPSLVRVESVNGESAEPPAERPLFDELTPTFASTALETVHGLPFGKGSRVAIGGPPGAGATRLLREVIGAIEGDLDVLVVLAGVRPEEVTEWKRTDGVSVAGGGFDRPPDELAQIAEMAVERAKRIAERGGDAVLVIDGLDALAPAAARRIFSAARNTEEAGSLTIVAATGSGGELQRLATTRVVLTPEGTLDAPASGTLRAELLGG